MRKGSLIRVVVIDEDDDDVDSFLLPSYTNMNIPFAFITWIDRSK